MVVAQDQYGYKWVKWLTDIEVSNDTGYLGYWKAKDIPMTQQYPVAEALVLV